MKTPLCAVLSSDWERLWSLTASGLVAAAGMTHYLTPPLAIPLALTLNCLVHKADGKCNDEYDVSNKINKTSRHT